MKSTCRRGRRHAKEVLRKMKKVLGLILAALLLLSALPTAALAEETGTQTATETASTEGQTGTIVNCKTRVNVREKPTQNSKLLGKADKGTTFTVLGASKNWVRIDFNGKDGYVYKTYIRVEGTPADTAVEGKVGTIVNCRTSTNVREKATSDSEKLGTAKRGEQFKVLATAGNWVKIQYKTDKAGYVFKTYIKVTNESSEQPVEGKRGMIVNCKYAVNVRAKASDSSKILGTIAKGAIFEVLGREGSWIKFEYRDSEIGYVFKSFVKLLDEEETIEGKTGTIRCNTHVNIRAKATKSSKLLGTAKNGETFTVRGRSGNWIKIDFKGQTGYVYKTYIRIA